MTNQPLRVAIWCAVSSEAQATEDKISIADQERMGRDLCTQNGWIVSDVFRIVHSRNYIDIHEFAHDLRKTGNDAIDRLFAHWEHGTIDLIIVRDSTRLGRKQTLVMHIIEMSITSGINLYSIQDAGMVDQSNYRIWGMMGGFKASTDVDNLVKAMRKGMLNRVKRGLHTGYKPIFSHRVIRDPRSGKERHLELDPQYDRLWHDLATLILEGVSWRTIDNELYERFGHVQKFGKRINKPYQPFRMYNLIFNPMFWGHTAYNHINTPLDLWRIEEGHTIPKGVNIAYNTVPAVYQGDLGEQIKEEIRYRKSQHKGRRTKRTVHMFSGLFVCGECYYNLLHSKPDRWHCFSHWEQSDTRPDCYQYKFALQNADVQDYMQNLLEHIIEIGDVNLSTLPNTPQTDEKSQIERLSVEIEALETQARKVVNLLSSGHDQLIDTYQSELERINIQLRHIKGEKLSIEHRAKNRTRNNQKQQHSLREIQQIGLDAFWDQDSAHINRILHQLIGEQRFVVHNGEITALTKRPNHYK